MSKKSIIVRSYQHVTRLANSKRVRRALLAAVIAGASLASSTTTQADEVVRQNDVRRGGISILVHEFTGDEMACPPPASAPIVCYPSVCTPLPAMLPAMPVAEETVQPQPSRIDTASTCDYLADVLASDDCEYSRTTGTYGTHDCVPEPLIESKDIRSIPTPVAEVKVDRFDKVIAAAVAASAAKIGISIEQILEPFAMVGPIAEDTDEISESIEQVLAQVAPSEQQIADAIALNRWWLDTDTVDAQTTVSDQVVDSESTGEVEGLLAGSLDLEPGVVSEFVVSDLIIDDIQVASDEDALVGSSPMIVTIQDAYLPYDLAQRDLELNLLPLTTVLPITPKNYVEVPASSDNSVVTDGLQTQVPPTQGAPECLLDEWLYDASELVERTGVRDWTFAKLGESFGDWVAALSPRRAQVVQDATEIAMMDVDGVAIPAPVADPIPNAENASEIATLLETDAVDIDQFDIAMNDVITMNVDGEMVPAPVADPVPDAEPIERMVLSQPEVNEVVSVDLAINTQADDASEDQIVEIVDEEQVRADIADLIATINQWHQRAMNLIPTSSEAASEGSNGASQPVVEVAKKVDTVVENKLR